LCKEEKGGCFFRPVRAPARQLLKESHPQGKISKKFDKRRTAMLNKIMNFVRDEEGASAVEYGLLASLIAAVIVLAVTALGTTLRTTFEEITTGIGG
jgi:pilus assembly protein Flp/PilA